MTRLIKFSDWEIKTLRDMLDAKFEIFEMTFPNYEDRKRAVHMLNKIGCNRSVDENP